jgi:putative flippase GtrA
VSSTPDSAGPARPRQARRRALTAEGLRYAMVAVFSFTWIIGCSAFLHEVAGTSEQLAVAVALATALIVNFTLLRLFVFPGQSMSLVGQFAAVAVTSASFRLFEYGLFLLLGALLGLFYLAATALAVLVSAVAKFLVYRNLVFRRRGAAGAAQSSTFSSEGASSTRVAGAKAPGS